MGIELKIGQPIKRGEDIFIRDKEGKIVGKKNCHIEKVEESKEDIAQREKLHKEHLASLYKMQRKEEYPDYGEFADMMYHDIDYIVQNGHMDQLTPAQKAWYEKCKAVKDKYPKPSK